MRSKKKILSMFGIAFTMTLTFILVIACSSKTNYSQTNTQVEGVDEPDIVKVMDDGKIFKAQSDGITMSQASNGHLELLQSKSASNVVPREILLYNNYLIAFNDIHQYGSYYDYNNYNSSNIEKTRMVIYDLSIEDSLDNSIRTVTFGGQYYTARLSGNELYFVVNVRYQVDAYYRDSAQSYQDISLESENNKNNVRIVLAKFDLSRITSAPVTKLVKQELKDIYFSGKSLYIIGEYEIDRRKGCDGGRPYYSDSITKISFDNFSTVSVNLGNLDKDGNYESYTIKDRYSLYDDGTYLMAVAEHYRSHSGMRTTILLVFNQMLSIRNALDYIATNERLYSVRFDQQFCYIVTFRNTDPLFKIDISDPLNLTILGDLMIVGVSLTLQPFGTDKLIGIGYNGDFRGLTTEIKVTLFDTSGNFPLEINSIVLYDYHYAEALYNARAILSEPENNLLAFYAADSDYENERSTMFIFGIDEEGQLIIQSEIKYEDEASYYYDYQYRITRLVRIDSYLYAISDGFISSYNMTDFTLIETLDTRLNN